MFQYKVIADPGIDGVFMGHILTSCGIDPYQDSNNEDVYVSADVVENNPAIFQEL